MPSYNLNYSILLCLSDIDFGELAQIIIAIANVLIVGYIFVYTKSKDRGDANRTLTIQEQNIRILWFKDLIVSPNLVLLNGFFEEIMSATADLRMTGLTDSEKIIISSKLKKSLSSFRLSFVQLLGIADQKIESSAIDNLDNLVDELCIVIFDLGVNLSHQPTFYREISRRIADAKYNLVKIIYNFKGV